MSIDFGDCSEWERNQLQKLLMNEFPLVDSPTPGFDSETISHGLKRKEVFWVFLTLSGNRRSCEFTLPLYNGPKEEIDEIEWMQTGRIPLVQLFTKLDVGFNMHLSKSMESETQNVTPNVSQHIFYHLFADMDDDAIKGIQLGETDKRTLGEVFGYPDWAIDAFLDDGTEVNTEQSPKAYAFEQGIPITEVVYISFTPFAITAEMTQIRKAIKRGKENYETLRTLANEYSYLSQLHTLLDEWIEIESSYIIQEVNSD